MRVDADLLAAHVEAVHGLLVLVLLVVPAVQDRLVLGIEVQRRLLVLLLEALDKAEKIKRQPTYIIAHTIKGKGVTFMEKNPMAWHGVAPNREEADRAIAEVRHRAGLSLEEAVR